MATLREWVSDLQLVLQKSKVSKDSRIHPKHLMGLIHKYRAVGIRQDYQKRMEISPSWLQNMGLCNVTIINSGEDTSIPCTTQTLGRFTIPQLVDLPDDAGLGSVFFPSKNGEWYKIDYNVFFGIPEGSDRSKFDYSLRIGTAIYISNPKDKASVMCILDNPLEGFMILSENVTSLIVGESYTVLKGNITTNGGITFFANSNNVFVASQTTFIGLGQVQFTNQKRRMTQDDPYPMSRTMGEFVCMKILANEFNLEPRSIADAKNDSQDQLVLLQPEENAGQR